MSERTNHLLSNWLDDSDTSSVDHDEAATSDASQSIAESLVVHGLLIDLGKCDEDHQAEQIRAVMQRIDSEPESNAGPPRSLNTRSRLAIVTSALAIAAAVIVMFVVLGPQQRVSAAMASLERVVEAAMKPLDRTFRVSVVEEYSRDKRPRNLSKAAWDREAPEQIDGATIYVRGPNKYVMTVLLKTGITRTSGCDNKFSWAFREDGPVHVTTDLNRFRGGMPGNKQDMPFLNIHANLSQLRVGYDVELTDSKEFAADDTQLSQLTCVRKAAEVHGIKRVELWFDPENGAVHKMLLDGLPRGRGGPKSVTLELIDQSELGPGFFSHESHHEPERKVKSE